MRKATRYLLVLYAFTLSWDTVALRFVGSFSRATGLALMSAALVTTLIQGRFRKPDPVLWLAFAFCGWSVLSLLWTISYPDTSTRAFTFVQVVASAWLMREFIDDRDQIEPILTAFCVGSFIPLASLLNNFWSGAALQETTRFSGSDLNPNTLGVALVIGLPMAWHLLRHRHGIVRIVAMVYFALTPLALLLTATRGGFLAGIVASTIIPLTLPRQSFKVYAATGLLLIVAIAASIVIVPAANWDRVLSISTEITEGGTMSGRTEIWTAGLQLYPEHPILGVGAGAYGVAVEPYVRFGRAINSHNTAIGLLVEEGIVGLSLFIALLAACAWTIFHLPSPYRVLWAVLLLTWLTGAMDGNLEYVKITWLLFGLISAQTGLKRPITAALSVPGGRFVAPMTTGFLAPDARARAR